MTGNGLTKDFKLPTYGLGYYVFNFLRFNSSKKVPGLRLTSG